MTVTTSGPCWTCRAPTLRDGVELDPREHLCTRCWRAIHAPPPTSLPGPGVGSTPTSWLDDNLNTVLAVAAFLMLLAVAIASA